LGSHRRVFGAQRRVIFVFRMKARFPAHPGNGSARAGRKSRRQNPADNQQTEKALTAWVTAIGRNSEPAFESHKRSVCYTRPRKSLQVKISAVRTMCVSREGERDAPSVEAAVASVASPRPEGHERANKIANALPMRSKAVRAAALRTNHFPDAPPCCRAGYSKSASGAS